MTPRSHFLLVSLLAGLWAEADNPGAFDDEIAALCREARDLGPVRAHTERERRRIYDARRCLGLTQAEAAAKIGVSAASISNWERGNCYCDADVVIAALQDPAHNRVPRRFVVPKPLEEDRP